MVASRTHCVQGVRDSFDHRLTSSPELPNGQVVRPYFLGEARVWASRITVELKSISPGSQPFPLIIVKIEKYTFGIGDRFAHQGRAQLQALLKAREAGIDVYPVWNKSNREH